LKRLASISLLILILSNTIGCYLVFYGDLLEARHEALVMILGHQALGDRVVELTFPVHDGRPQAAALTFTDDDEFMYQGRMYDVVSSATINGMVKYRCYTDAKETALNESLSNKIGTDRDSPVQNNKNTSQLKEHVKDYIPHSYRVSCLVPVSVLSYIHTLRASGQQYTYHPVVSPPPEFVLS
jgi:hypothetical protein